MVARTGKPLQELAETLQKEFGISAKTIAKDLSGPKAPEEIYSELGSQPIDVLVNNAGFGLSGLFKETDLATELGMLQLNIAALTHLTKLFLKDMIKRGSGKILNVASTAAFQPGPSMAVYYASKAYVLSFSEALACEVRGTGVSVTVLCPGLTESNFLARAGIRHSRLARLQMMDVDTVAQAGYEGLIQNKTVVIPGFINRVFVWLVSITPRSWATKIILWLHQKN